MVFENGDMSPIGIYRVCSCAGLLEQEMFVLGYEGRRTGEHKMC